MSGAQGAQPPGARTATTYESVQDSNRPKTDLRSKEDERGIKIDDLQDKVQDAAGLGGPVFGAARKDDDNKQDIGATGTA
ncbi:hypothetical protein Dsin_012041 [Dipteronia sinensis]|uniref:Seed maturation protein PM41 n=1 Tax=Dipteronia sinensis TaxID=43782 RepID=A0AAE0AHH8_9ROSI|nr:hypothetical protein Dsin_012041 [Dipteronia sinensis]